MTNPNSVTENNTTPEPWETTTQYGRADLALHPVVRDCYRVACLIERCGASEDLTRASSAAFDLCEKVFDVLMMLCAAGIDDEREAKRLRELLHAPGGNAKYQSQPEPGEQRFADDEPGEGLCPDNMHELVRAQAPGEQQSFDATRDYNQQQIDRGYRSGGIVERPAQAPSHEHTQPPRYAFTLQEIVTGETVHPHYRVADTRTDSRVATCYLQDNARLVTDALNEVASEADMWHARWMDASAEIARLEQSQPEPTAPQSPWQPSTKEQPEGNGHVLAWDTSEPKGPRRYAVILAGLVRLQRRAFTHWMPLPPEPEQSGQERTVKPGSEA